MSGDKVNTVGESAPIFSGLARTVAKRPIPPDRTIIKIEKALILRGGETIFSISDKSLEKDDSENENIGVTIGKLSVSGPPEHSILPWCKGKSRAVYRRLEACLSFPWEVNGKYGQIPPEADRGRVELPLNTAKGEIAKDIICTPLGGR